MRKTLLILALFSVSILLYAQDEYVISADRPGMATGTDVMPFLKVQWGTGFESSWDGSPGFLLPTTMFRFGITHFAEIRLEYDGNYNRKDIHEWG